MLKTENGHFMKTLRASLSLLAIAFHFQAAHAFTADVPRPSSEPNGADTLRTIDEFATATSVQNEGNPTTDSNAVTVPEVVTTASDTATQVVPSELQQALDFKSSDALAQNDSNKVETKSNETGKGADWKKDDLANIATGNVGAENKVTEVVAPEPNLWQGALFVVAGIAGIGALGLLLVRLKKRGGLSFSKSEKDMTILSTMPLSPKRQIILIKIRDQELALASTEHGITVLTEVRSMRPQVQVDARQMLPKVQEELSSRASAAAIPAKRAALPKAESNEDESRKHKSEIFLQALKSLKSKNVSKVERRVETAENVAGEAEEEVSSPLPARKRESAAASKTPTMNSTRASFPKYLANAFEQEQKRKVPVEDEEESVENVTNMIRQKLKTMNTMA